MRNNKAITPRNEDFSKWYTDVVKAARLAEYSPIRGCMVFEPNGYAIWENIQRIINKYFMELGIKNVYMPMLIPESLLSNEKNLVEGFSPEVAWVTAGGEEQLTERLAIRPTSETLFGDYFSKRVQSYKDLPILNNQWCSVLRWEKSSRPFLRNREFLWQEGHTVHASKTEAIKLTDKMIEIYRDFVENFLAIPVICGRKTESEKFAGAEFTNTIEALMYNGYTLQAGTSHYLGQNFAKAYDIKFADKDGKIKYAYTTSWGISTRLIGGLIMVHGDNSGLILPPKIAPVQVAIVPITKDEEVFETCRSLYNYISDFDIKVEIDKSDKSAGQKFAESEVQGIPIRLEIGKRDLKDNTFVMVSRDIGEKQTIKLNDKCANAIIKELSAIQKRMFDRARTRISELTFSATTIDEMLDQINKQPGFIEADWCGNESCEKKLKEAGSIKSRCIKGKNKGGVCVVCGEPAKNSVVWGLQY